MDTSNLSKALTCDEALEWLQKTLEDPENEDLYPDEVMRATLEIDWKSEEEFLEFFKEISIQLARTASKNTSEETVSLFGIPLCSALSLWSPYYMIWEKAFSTKSLRAPRKIGPAESIGQGRRLLGQESQSVLPGQTGIFRGALKTE